MTETMYIPSPRKPRISRLSAVILLTPLFILLASFRPAGYPPTFGANDAESLQFRSEVVGYAQNFLGLRYRSAGRSPKTGFDCSGFTRFVLDEFGLAVSSSSTLQSTQGVKKSLKDVLPGDLVFFGSPGRIQHVAMVVENTRDGIICVHSTCSRGIIVENISTSKYWKPKILFARDVIRGGDL